MRMWSNDDVLSLTFNDLLINTTFPYGWYIIDLCQCNHRFSGQLILDTYS
ncbi:hypothetical protein DICPUDRAFT_147542 [Dictyostelium purpureum]|uniref:Uncharacterized protein n=1 Tax=Dictyostelium purpureum TaxID=5786 RepID=F0Z8R8_DICPU|nr:uncharacterized protein DICPUDRAFT_147542 [Dictyostelium purpureum]EGC39679.1 hypothetical protein DICPUDRAFT_147542 [Dictyostelium purpureum]|eukprot:XP_003283788.1 hypothetical protein DICPUDRAFT_147542 [Dictyostelium purpureum]